MPVAWTMVFGPREANGLVPISKLGASSTLRIGVGWPGLD